jgi:hypothetical protein
MKNVSDLEDMFGDIYCSSTVTESLDSQYKKFTLEQAIKAQRGSRGIALFFL